MAHTVPTRRSSDLLLEKPVCAEKEEAGVPNMVALRDHRCGARFVGFLDEARDLMHGVGDRIAQSDIAIARRRLVGRDPDRHAPANARTELVLSDGGTEGRETDRRGWGTEGGRRC